MLISAAFHHEDAAMRHVSNSLLATRQRSASYLSRLSRWMQERREIHMLDRMSDAQLKDIGISRADIGRAVRSTDPWGMGH